ncbi:MULTISPECIES: FCD domain-containing protein [Rhodobacterales]|uniref:GntR family transcriptional regulator n=1 Tax=Roseobacter sp. N2S TaxID=2663844 RepID=UPI00286696DA|nr:MULTISPECIES: FCD domain-containing protein [Rhodobacterales]MDR6265719.1 DNA-binding GntR family transcriptional regulator [Roseobacter sp. N2S]
MKTTTADSTTGPAKTTAERAYRLLREDIVSGALAPGQKLKIEMLRSRYDIGSGPLREAMSRLAGDHLVEILGQRGFLVAPFTAQDAREIGDLRKMVEAEALGQSIPLGDSTWEERVITTFHRLERQETGPAQGVEALSEWERLNHAFHEALVAACPSVWLLRTRDSMFKHHERYRRLSRVRTVLTRDIHTEHRELLDAALDKDVEMAQRVIRLHIESTTQAVVLAIENLANA